MEIVIANHFEYSPKMLLKISRLRNIMQTAWRISRTKNIEFSKALRKAWALDRKSVKNQFSLF